MAKEKQPVETPVEPEVLEAELVHVGPLLSQRTREEMEFGRKQAAANAAAMQRAAEARNNE